MALPITTQPKAEIGPKDYPLPNDWNVGLFNCCDDMKICCLTTFCGLCYGCMVSSLHYKFFCSWLSDFFVEYGDISIQKNLWSWIDYWRERLSFNFSSNAAIFCRFSFHCADKPPAYTFEKFIHRTLSYTSLFSTKECRVGLIKFHN